MTILRKSLTAVTVVGLGVDAWVHFSLASTYDAVHASVSQGALFRVEATAAVVAAVLLLIRPNRLTAAIAALVAGGGLLALLLYRYVDVGQLGPFPNMYEPLWYAKKTWTAIAQAVATGTAIALVILGPTRRRGAEQPTGH
jgi:hypothetical protein